MTSTALRATCGAHARQTGRPCRNQAGFKTDHLGEGRCYLHGGKNPVRHGRYSTVTREPIRRLIEEYEADPDPLNTLPELATARALLVDYLERYDENTAALRAWHASYQRGDENAGELKPRQVLDIAHARELLETVTRVVERIERIRAANAISRPELLRVMSEMGRVVQAHVTDEATLARIKDGWLAIHV